MLPAVSLLLLLAIYGALIRRSPRPRLFGAGPHAVYRRWLARTPVLLGGGTVLALILLGRTDALDAMPPEFLPAADLVVYTIGGYLDAPSFAPMIVVALVAGGGLGAILDAWRRRRGKGPVMLGDISAIQPRAWHDYAPAALVGSIAGVVEEAFFRLALPLAIALASGSVLVAHAVALGLFAAAHRYQGWGGIAGSLVMGLVMAVLYLASGALWLAMLVHALVNLNALILRPALARVQLFRR